LGTSDRRTRVAPATVYEGMAKMCVKRCEQDKGETQVGRPCL
jgi:hypothetical protein